MVGLGDEQWASIIKQLAPESGGYVKERAVLETSSAYILSGTSTTTDDYMRNEILDMLEGCPPSKIKLIAQVIKPIIDYKG